MGFTLQGFDPFLHGLSPYFGTIAGDGRPVGAAPRPGSVGAAPTIRLKRSLSRTLTLHLSQTARMIANDP